MLHGKQPDVASHSWSETKPLAMGPSLFFYLDQDNNPTRMSGICFTKTSNTYYFSIDYFSLTLSLPGAFMHDFLLFPEAIRRFIPIRE